jgi:hypothetical protein
MEVKALITIAIFLLSVSSALAQTTEYCLDNSTLVSTSKVVINVPERNIIRTINVTENINCPYGCNPSLNQCNINPIWRFLLVCAAIIVICFMIYKIFEGRISIR